MERLDDFLIKLKERFAAGADDVAMGIWRWPRRPAVRHRAGQLLRRGEPASADAIRSHEVGVAELANGRMTIGLAAGPQVTPAEPAEYRWPTALRPLSLQGVENLLDGVGHPTMATRYGEGSAIPFSAKPLRRSRQASQCPHASPFADGS